MSGWQITLIVMAAVGAAVNAGAFFAFSNFVMPALAKLDQAEGIRSMQQINIEAPNPLFVAAILGSGPVAVPAVIADWDPTLAVAIALSVLSAMITMTLNVPRNNALAAVDASTQAGQRVWADYLVTWTRANTARTLASAGSVALFVLATAG